MNLEQKAFGVLWHVWSELRVIKDVICIGKLIPFQMLNHICLTNSFFGGGRGCHFQTWIAHTITLISKVMQTIT